MPPPSLVCYTKLLSCYIKLIAEWSLHVSWYASKLKYYVPGCMHVFMYACMYVCMYVRMYVCLHFKASMCTLTYEHYNFGSNLKLCCSLNYMVLY